MSTIERVRTLVAEGRMSRAGLARAAGLHANTLRDCTEPGWNPTAATLAKIERFLDENESSRGLVPIEEIIDEARNGRMFILVDDEDRENEGDLVIPAQMSTPDAINFMATHGRGLICLALTPERVSALGLQPMSRTNRSRMETAFTTSIEAREGVTTGISAADRARTISVAIDAAKGPEHIVSPGHVFPLVAREGGVLVRAGHTEAAVDVARLAMTEQMMMACILIVEARFYAHLYDLLLAGARAAIEAEGHSHETVTVPGALEVPGAIALAAESGRYEAFVALGVVIRGETYHFEIVAGESARAL